MITSERATAYQSTVATATPLVPVTIAPGDGIGPEITEATLHVIEATGVTIGADAVRDLQTRVGHARNRPARTEIDIVGMSGHDEHAGHALREHGISHTPTLRSVIMRT